MFGTGTLYEPGPDDERLSGTCLHVIESLQIGPLYFEARLPDTKEGYEGPTEIKAAGFTALKTILASHGITKASEHVGFVQWVFEKVVERGAWETRYLNLEIDHLEEGWGDALSGSDDESGPGSSVP